MVHKGLFLNISAIKKIASKMTSNISIIPRDDPKQVLRLRRFFETLVIYILNISIAYFAYLAGIMNLQALYGFWIITLAINIILYIVFRTGLNLWMSDPSLTSIQMCAANLVVMYGLYYIYEIRGFLLSIYILILLFGIFRLYTRQFLFVSAFALLTYGVDIVLLNIFHPQVINSKIECFQWFGMAIVLISVSLIGGKISSLRRELSVSQKKLQSSLTVIREMAIHDDLTGFYNRHHLMDIIDSENNRSVRTGSVFSLVMMDIDKFKSINDTYGHQTGDQVLRTLAAIIRSMLRKTDFCGRYGGEEFLIVLTQTDLQAANVFAERIRECIENSFFPDLGPYSRITVSLGLAEHRIQGNIEKTISRADDALYKAKKRGRNRVECSD
ncbi:MAG: diguanylate cyclase [Smithella sp.]|jgi:diguanylate cyclase (GGDEF)-like protein